MFAQPGFDLRAAIARGFDGVFYLGLRGPGFASLVLYFAELLAKTEPQRFVANMSKARRQGRMFIDYLRNGQGSTAVCPWSTRARAGGTVAVPVTWDELQEIDRANAFDVFSAAARADGPDAWDGYFEVTQVLTKNIQDVVDR